MRVFKKFTKQMTKQGNDICKIECKLCGKTKLTWVTTKNGKNLLVDKNGNKHYCIFRCPACDTEFESYDQAILCCVDKVTESLRGYGFKIYG